jgi:ArsR family transcriptional regulator
MSKQAGLPVLGQDAVCCAPMVREPLGEEDAAELSRMFKALSDPIRLRLLSLIASHEGGEACVCDLTGPFDVSQPTISHHLKVLREAGVTRTRRDGTTRYVSLRRDDLDQRFPALLDAVLASAPTGA